MEDKYITEKVNCVREGTKKEEFRGYIENGFIFFTHVKSNSNWINLYTDLMDELPPSNNEIYIYHDTIFPVHILYRILFSDVRSIIVYSAKSIWKFESLYKVDDNDNEREIIDSIHSNIMIEAGKKSFSGINKNIEELVKLYGLNVTLFTGKIKWKNEIPFKKFRIIENSFIETLFKRENRNFKLKENFKNILTIDYIYDSYNIIQFHSIMPIFRKALLESILNKNLKDPSLEIELRLGRIIQDNKDISGKYEIVKNGRFDPNLESNVFVNLVNKLFSNFRNDMKIVYSIDEIYTRGRRTVKNVEMVFREDERQPSFTLNTILSQENKKGMTIDNIPTELLTSYKIQDLLNKNPENAFQKYTLNLFEIIEPENTESEMLIYAISESLKKFGYIKNNENSINNLLFKLLNTENNRTIEMNVRDYVYYYQNDKPYLYFPLLPYSTDEYDIFRYLDLSENENKNKSITKVDQKHINLSTDLKYNIRFSSQYEKEEKVDEKYLFTRRKFRYSFTILTFQFDITHIFQNQITTSEVEIELNSKILNSIKDNVKIDKYINLLIYLIQWLIN